MFAEGIVWLNPLDVRRFAPNSQWMKSAARCCRREASGNIQKIIEDMNPWTEDLMFKLGMGVFKKISALSKKAGVEKIELSPAERARWVEAAKSVERDWVAGLDAKGLPATAMYNDILKLLGER